MAQKILLIALATLIILPLAHARAAQDPAPAKPALTYPFLIPGGPATPDAAIAFLDTDQGLAAVELATGKTLWQSAEPVAAILATADALVVTVRHDENFTLACFDPRTGKKLRESQPIRFTAKLGPRYHLGATAAITPADQLVVNWTAVEFYDGGAAKKIAMSRGSFQFDPATAKLTKLTKLTTLDTDPLPLNPPANPIHAKLATVTLKLEEISETKLNVRTTHRTLIATNAQGETAWSLPLRTHVQYPPKP